MADCQTFLLSCCINRSDPPGPGDATLGLCRKCEGVNTGSETRGVTSEAAGIKFTGSEAHTLNQEEVCYGQTK